MEIYYFSIRPFNWSLIAKRSVWCNDWTFIYTYTWTSLLSLYCVRVYCTCSINICILLYGLFLHFTHFWRISAVAIQMLFRHLKLPRRILAVVLKTFSPFYPPWSISAVGIQTVSPFVVVALQTVFPFGSSFAYLSRCFTVFLRLTIPLHI